MDTIKITNFELFDVVSLGDKDELNDLTSNRVFLQGWVRTNRNNGQVGFIEFNDGTFLKYVYITQNIRCPQWRRVVFVILWRQKWKK